MNETKEEIKPVRIISDVTEEGNAQFGFDVYINTIADLIAYAENKTPLVIGVYGKWGSGKTTLMKSIQNKLKKDEKKRKGSPDPKYRTCKTVWFQAWKYKNEDEVMAALIAEIFKAMEEDSFFQSCKAEIERLATGINKPKLFFSLIKKVTTIDLSEFLQDPEYQKSLGFYEVFDDFFTRLIWTWLSWRPKLKKCEAFDEKKGVLSIFIDDLDRCPEPKIVQVLETIKLFMDKQGCVFVIGADNDIIIKALKKTYPEDALRFMDKIVQVTFNLPKIREKDFTDFITGCGNDSEGELINHLPLIIPAMENNPRNVKRFINDLNLQQGLVENKKLNIAYKTILLWKVLEKGYALFHDALKEGGGFRTLKTMQDWIQQFKTEDQVDPEMIRENMEKIPESLKGYFNNINLVRIVDQFRLGEEKDLEELITLAGITGSSVEFSGTASVRPKTAGSRKMAFIPKGNFIYQDNEDRTIGNDYEMDIYPVTNELFKKFILAGGYAAKDLWVPAGWQWKEKKNITKPGYWEDETYNDPEQPVVGVSWYEADAYARWLSELEKEKGYTYRLPKEEEWERAARGDKGNIWPWGNDFDKDKCNSSESGLGKPSRVTVYPNGVSPYGCYDMAGNVWEWTSSFYDKNEKSYALRGGSFSDGSVLCRCPDRIDLFPVERDFFIGFRCARIKL